ncbi:hypothetical protein C8R44DRAFT_738179 [Mycena epipterygia]|nr:hypothetical protein C8R44DRAFT_738179 [Mycena epipterygia]
MILRGYDSGTSAPPRRHLDKAHFFVGQGTASGVSARPHPPSRRDTMRVLLREFTRIRKTGTHSAARPKPLRVVRSLPAARSCVLRLLSSGAVGPPYARLVPVIRGPGTARTLGHSAFIDGNAQDGFHPQRAQIARIVRFVRGAVALMSARGGRLALSAQDFHAGRGLKAVHVLEWITQANSPLAFISATRPGLVGLRQRTNFEG